MEKIIKYREVVSTDRNLAKVLLPVIEDWCEENNIRQVTFPIIADKIGESLKKVRLINKEGSNL